MAKELVIQGDCLDVLKTFEDNSVDSVVTDPPYGLSKEPNIREVLTKWLNGEPYDHNHGGFMGKAWDSFVPHPDIWREVFRVLKPGGHALVFAGTRTQDLMTISLRLAGFEVRDVIEWLYFSGFPKSHDVSKAFDKLGGNPAKCREAKAFLVEALGNSGLTRKELNEMCGFECTNYLRFDNHLSHVVPPPTKWEKIKSVLNLKETPFDDVIKTVDREKVRSQTKSASTYHTQNVGDRVERIDTYDITEPATELARKWDGWGTALKPAHEPIIVVRKPLIDADTGRKMTVVDCVEKYGTGAINIDASRIGDGSDRSAGGLRQEHHAESMTSIAPHTKDQKERPTGGRFPANCITLDSDQFYSKYFNVTPTELSKKASKKDRNSDWRGEEIALPVQESKKFSGGKFAKNGDGTPRASNGGNLRNTHPTVKPTDLMAWLVRLVTPEGGTVLDPFAGSGSTLVAAKREGFGFIGIEREPEYVEIIEARTHIKAIKCESEAE